VQRQDPVCFCSTESSAPEMRSRLSRPGFTVAGPNWIFLCSEFLYGAGSQFSFSARSRTCQESLLSPIFLIQGVVRHSIPVLCSSLITRQGDHVRFSFASVRTVFSRDVRSVPLSRSPLSVFAAASASVKSAPFLLRLRSALVLSIF
jgi:hypothetical protein